MSSAVFESRPDVGSSSSRTLDGRKEGKGKGDEEGEGVMTGYFLEEVENEEKGGNSKHWEYCISSTFLPFLPLSLCVLPGIYQQLQSH